MDFLPTLPISVIPLIAFGILLLGGAVGGYLAHRISWLPSITGFMMLGFIVGPSTLGLLSQEAMNNSKIIIDVALALILYRLGLSLDLRKIYHSPKLILISIIESAVTFVGVFAILSWFKLPLAVSTAVAAIAISSSPAVLLHVAHEVGAHGRVTESTKTLVALNNFISFLIFSAVLPLMHHAVGNDLREIILQPSYRLFGSVGLAIAVGYVLHYLALFMRDAAQYKLAIVIGSMMLSLGVARELNLSLLIVPLAIGSTIATIEDEHPLSGIEFGSSFELFFIVLFVYAGANLHLEEFVESGLLIVSLVVVRSLAKVSGVALTAGLQKFSIRDGFASGLLLIPMAGLAIGLTQTVSDLFPDYAGAISAIVLGSVALFETIGPPIAKTAFKICGEFDEEYAAEVAKEEAKREAAVVIREEAAKAVQNEAIAKQEEVAENELGNGEAAIDKDKA